ncbi:MAG: RNA polymerase sigma factor [Bacteroidales bacterium]|jgi:RNA polymerase sigma-70 factor (ECF subfamily)
MLNKEDTFNSIVNENNERIQRICSYYNSNKEEQKDMYQEILVNIWKSLKNFRGNSALSTWVYRVAVNTALNYTGKAYKQMKLIVDKKVESIRAIVDDDEVAGKMLEEQQYKELQIALNLLSVIDKALISLLLEGLTMKEIADVIGITESNVKVKLHRIKSQLRDQLNHGDHESNK